MFAINSLPHHLCDTIDNASVELLFQSWKGKRANILVIGESPALNGRILSWKAFYTKEWKLVPSGKRFNTLVEEFWFGIEDVSFTEICKCVVGAERNLLKKCAPKCRSHLQHQIDHYRPKLIIILGVHTLEIVNMIAHTHINVGELQKIEINKKAYNILGIYHPSPINPKSMERNKKIINDNRNDLHSLIQNFSSHD